MDIAVGYHSASHYATIQALEPFLGVDGTRRSFQGLPNDRVRRRLRGEVLAATVFGAQYYVVEQRGNRKPCDATFAVGFLIADAALERAQRDIDLRPDQFLHYWTRELPEDIAALVDVRRFGPGERIVFSPYTKEIFDTTQQWMATHGLLDLEIQSTFADVVM